jgi:hypothetical protein
MRRLFLRLFALVLMCGLLASLNSSSQPQAQAFDECSECGDACRDQRTTCLAMGFPVSVCHAQFTECIADCMYPTGPCM